MDEIMNTVDVNLPESAADDAQQASESSADLLNAVNTAHDNQNQQNAQSAEEKEPSWYKRRFEKDAQKLLAKQRAELQAEFDRQLAPLRESMLERQAQELVASGEFKSKEVALEYVRLKNGMPSIATETPTPAAPGTPARDSQGRFTKPPEGVSDANAARADYLAKQAERIKSKRGLDVMTAFNNDPEIQKRVLSDEWDFYDVAEYMQQKKNTSSPTPIRMPGGNPGNYDVSIANMTDAQFKKLQENLASGHRYDMRK